MQMQSKPSLAKRFKNLLIGSPIKVESKIFHRLSLIALFAWVGLGADGLSSSSYGPAEAFLALQGHTYLGIFVALATILTIFVIGASYSQIIELFPGGGGGYVVASKLLSPRTGMISGSALLIDYALTITVSIAAGAAAIFSFLPLEWQSLRLAFAISGVFVLTLMNLRGIKESVLPLVPIFIIFFITHVFVIIYAIAMHSAQIPAVVNAVNTDMKNTSLEIGVIGMILLILRAYSMGAGTYTGLEAVSNGLPVLQEPKVQTAKRTMRYMVISLAFVAGGLMLAYLLYNVESQPGRILNAVLFEDITAGWSKDLGNLFVLVTLVSEATLLFVAAQAGFLDGPRVLANMALDGWVPKRFALLSDRFVSQNGILIMGGAALALMILTQGSVEFLVILYSINVFITFLLSQLGIVRYLWNFRPKVKQWYRKFFVSGIGVILTAFILFSVTAFKFYQGGWITLLITGMSIGILLAIKRHYDYTAKLLKSLDNSILEADARSEYPVDITRNLKPYPEFDPEAKTAVLFVNGFNGLGLHTLANVISLFGGVFKNFVFVQIGMIDARSFKEESEIEKLQTDVKNDVEKYANLMRRQGYYAEGIYSIGIDVAEEIDKIAPGILERFPRAVFFGGQIIFLRYSFLSRFLHNYSIFAMQRRLYPQGIPVVILPIKV